MDDRSLEELLRGADRVTAGAPHSAAGLATRVRTLQQRRRRQTLATGVGIAGLAVVVVFALFQRGPRGTAGSSGDVESGSTAGLPSSDNVGATGGLSASAEKEAKNWDIQTLMNERSQLAAEAESRARVARLLIDFDKRNRRIEDLRRERRRPDALILAREEVDKAAFRLITRADDLRERQGAENAAAAIYREVVQLFPEAPSAAVARQRLSDNTSKKGAML